MRAHSQVASVQKEGCRALRSLTKRIGPESATESGTVEAVLDAMQAHLQVAQAVAEEMCKWRMRIMSLRSLRTGPDGRDGLPGFWLLPPKFVSWRWLVGELSP